MGRVRYCVCYLVFIPSLTFRRYPLNESTWEPPEHFSNDPDKIKEFLEWWAAENPTVDMASLDSRETIFLDAAFVLARAGVTWLGGA
jgi:hypothetical protein